MSFDNGTRMRACSILSLSLIVEVEFDCRSVGKETEMDYNKICNVRFISMKSEGNILLNVYQSRNAVFDHQEIGFTSDNNFQSLFFKTLLLKAILIRP